MKGRFLLSAGCLAGGGMAFAQGESVKTVPMPDTRPQNPVLAANAPSGRPVVNVLLRQRGNATQWFGALPNPETYGHGDSLLRVSIAQRVQRVDWQLEMSNNSELLLPTDAVSPVPDQGQLGLGGTFYAANSNNNWPAAVSFKTGWARFHFNGDKTLLRVGRFEFIDGSETTPKAPVMLWVQNNRTTHRLIGNFGFSNGQRSLDGVEFKTGGPDWDVTAMGARPVQGVFKMAGNEELNADVQYLAYTRYAAKQHVLFRAFGVNYHDGRTGLTKTDNRALAVRSLDRQNIRVQSFGGDMIASIPVGRQNVDLMVWGGGQTGRWGVQDHRAGAIALEGGVKLNTVATQPWLRGGFVRTTGDKDPNDNLHGTWFQTLTTPRNYARYPFFNMMNSSDEFVQLIDKPSPRAEIRTDLHFLQLTSARDLWYQGGGVFDTKAFGYVGRSSNGRSSFASLYDVSVDYAVSDRITMTAYYARAFGKTVVAAIYPVDRNSNYGYIELLYHFSKKM